MTGFFTSELRAATTDEAQTHLRDLYGDVDLGGLGGYRETVVGDSRSAVAEVEPDGSSDVRAEVDAVTLASSTPGYRWRVDRDEGDLSAAPAVFQPQEPMTSRIDGSTRVITVDLAVPASTGFAAALNPSASASPGSTLERPRWATGSSSWPGR